ncbi:DUF2087 domain-containing protein [Aerococcaceae bacterium zg-ZJ1578]|uniref:DUF2087 domain-containing protein n=1 Tax=Aerococcaceae bacterium zg-252 TaxID=2796928 RepID=UPI001A29E4B1|nr:DUF2087 domain-containing protein [Aerococcaceae bacterium zg-1578]
MENIEKYLKGGKLKVIPRKEKNKIEIFQFFAETLKKQPQETFTEKELNQIIAEIYDDYAIIRRYLVDYGFLVRDDYGKEYRLNEKTDDLV